MKRSFVLTIVFSLLIATFCFDCKDEPPKPEVALQVAAVPKPTPEPPFEFPDGITTIVDSLVAERLENGGILLTGRLKMPKGTEFMLNIFKRGTRKVVGVTKFKLTENGRFKTETFFDHGGYRPYQPGAPAYVKKPGPYAKGNYRIELVSYFNGPWQQERQVMKVAGENGKRLPAKISIPDDIEFPEIGRHIEFTTRVKFPPLTPEYKAIQAVKKATLSTPEWGRSAATVEEIVSLTIRLSNALGNANNARVKAWKAKQNENGLWIVTMEWFSGDEHLSASWSYNAKNRRVKYLDPGAKNLSYIAE